VIAELAAVLLVRLEQSPCNPQPERTGLPRRPTTIESRLYIERTQGVGRRERLLDVLDQRPTGKEVAKRAPIYVPLPGSGR
jgi:hypothetical protein